MEFISNFIITLMKAIQILLILLMFSAVSAETLQLFSASTFLSTPSSSLSGSLKGGRTIYIQGVGFPTDPNLLQVYVGSYPCKIAADGVTPTVISCQTSDAFSQVDVKTLTISVISENQYYTVPGTYYNYLNSDTPSLSNVFPSSSIAGQRIHFYGTHRVLDFGDGLRDMGDFLGLYIGGCTCSMFDITQDTINYNSLTRVQCIQSATQTAGRYNITQHVIAGWASKQYTMRKPSLQNIYYQHTVIPSIQDIIPRSGFDVGQKLMITGSGFSSDSSLINVTVDGTLCQVQASSFNQIKCLLKQKKVNVSSLLPTGNISAQVKGYIGGAGFQYQRYDISNLPSPSLNTFKSAYLNQINVTLVQKKKVFELQTRDIYGSYYGQVFKGYFYAPTSGNYTFRGAGDDQFALSINPIFGTTSGSMLSVISSNSYGYSADNYYVSNFTSTFGAPIDLVQGKYYYMQLYHVNLDGSGFLKISVEVPNNDSSLAKQAFQINHFQTTFTNDPEILTFTLDGATSGSFNLSFIRKNPATLAITYSKQVSISASASQNQFQAALNSFDSYSAYDTICTNATAFDSSGTIVSLASLSKTKIVWTVSIGKLRTTTQIAERFTFKKATLVSSGSMIPGFTQATVKSHGSLINGTFRMDIGGQSIKLFDSVGGAFTNLNIPYNVAQSALQAAFRQIIGFENVQVVRLGTPQYGAKWIISYYDYNQDVPNITFSGNLLTGGKSSTNPVIKFYQTRKWSKNILFNPVSEIFLYSAASLPSVIVKVNNIPSACSSANCFYTMISSVPQIISQSSSRSGQIISVTISDPMNRNFGLADLEATLDNQKCKIVSGTYTAFTCNVPVNDNGFPLIRAGSYNISLFINGYGFVKIRAGISTLNYDLQLISLDRNSGGTNGGYQIRIFGKGFPLNKEEKIEVRLCGISSLIISAGSTQTTIIAPQCTAGANQLNYTYNGISKVIAFTYVLQSIGSLISSISPNTFSPVKKGIMRISGRGFGNNISEVTVYLANSTRKIYLMKVLSVNDTQIKCGIPGGLPGDYKVMVSISGIGDIPSTAGSTNFTYQLSIYNISPQNGSYYGGTLVNITGKNFSPDILENIVSIGNQLNTVCRIQFLNESLIKCRMPPTNPNWISNKQKVIVTNKIIADSSCPSNNCFYTYSNQYDGPNITQINCTSALSGKSIIQIIGNKFDLTNYSNVQVILQNKITEVISVAPISFINKTTINFLTPNLEGGMYLLRIRFDPIGQTNSISLNLNISLNLTSLQGSLKGGIINVIGFGLPSSWPSKLYNLLITLNSIPIKIEVLSATPSSLQIKAPQITTPSSYYLTLTSPTKQKVAVTFTQGSLATPPLTIQQTTFIDSGQQNITLNRSINSFSAKLISSITLYNVLTPQILLTVANWTYQGTFIKFKYVFPAGKYGINVYFPNYGWANCTQYISISNSSVYSVQNVNVSIFGGQIKVFGTDIGPGSIVKVGGFVGKRIYSFSNYSVFQIPPLMTPQLLNQFPSKNKEEYIKPSSIISDGGNNSKSVFDNIHSSFYSSSNSNCYIGIDVGESKLIDIRRIRYFPYYKWEIVSKYLKGATIEGSNNGINYTIITMIDQTSHAGWNSIKLDNVNRFRYVRFKHNSTSGCNLSEFQVYGVILNDVPVSSLSDFTTSLTYADGLTNYIFPRAVRYLNQSTPIIQKLQPNNGSIYGGTTIQFWGSNLSISPPFVSIDGIQCLINNGSRNSTYFSCITQPRLTLPSSNTFVVKIGQQNPLIMDQFFYVMRWSDSRTWGTDLPPVEGDLIYIPKGMTLMVDQSTPRLDGIIIEDGKIIFSDQVDMEIHTNFITINRGEFRAGTQLKPYKKKLTFIMYGSYYGKQQPMFGNKGIGCLQCKFSMYGTPRFKTWTLISSTINVGATSLSVIDDVDWKIGEQIVVASTDFDHNQAQQRTITNITGRLITVNEPFKYKHFGQIQLYGTDKADMRAEVGLLTRNIKMMGDPTSLAGQYGSHLMMAGKSENGLISHIAYTQFTNCGQPRIVGRYCIHFHMNGDVADSYAKGNAVHHSFARVITIHGVHFLHVSENVGYRVKGHNFFVEDGIQTQNLIEKNLAIGSLQSWNMLQSDTSVASFWITNPTNNVRGNRAAGGDFYGFWYEIKVHPDGPSATIDVCPIGNPLGQSHDNVAHSYKRFGLRVFKLYSRQIPCDPIRDNTLADPWSSNPSIQSKFYNYLIYKCGQAGLLAEETGNVIFQNFTIAQSKLAGMEFYRTNKTKEYVEARDIAIIGLTRNNPPANLSILNGTRGVIGPRTNQWKMSNVRFRNFPMNTVAVETCSKCQNLLIYTNVANQYIFTNITFSNFSGNYLFMKGLKREIIYDTDASFSKNFNNISKISATVVWNFKHLQIEPNCTNATYPQYWDNALVCDETVTIRKAMFTNLANHNIFWKSPMKVQLIQTESQIVANNSRLFTQFYSLMDNMQPKLDKPMSYAIPFAINRIYSTWWLTGLDFNHLNIDVSKLFVDSDPAILFRFNYTQNRELFQIGHFFNNAVNGPLINQTSANSTLNRYNCRFGDYIHDITSKTLTICATSRGKVRPFEYLDINSIKCRYMCPTSPGQIAKQTFIRKWSNATQWPNQTVPTSYQNVTIPIQWTIMIDSNPAPINFLLIDGDVIISPALQEVNITAKGIWIRAGSIQAGTSSEAFPGKINIQLQGKRQDSGFIINGDIGGNKLFVIHGRLELYGLVPAVTWVRAKNIVRKGDTNVTVNSSVSDWQIGDQIVLGPSFSNSSQHEKVRIVRLDNITNTIFFSPALNFTHYGNTTVTVNNTIGILDTRAAIGLLSRRIKILSGPEEGWGFQTIVNGFRDGQKLRSGSIILQGVEFYNGGQYDTENTALKILNTVGSDKIVISKSSFHNCKSYCLYVSNINNAFVQNNVFYFARVLHVRALKLNSFTFSNNLMIAAVKRSTMGKVFTQLIACYLTYEPLHNLGVSITQNLCQGSDYHGFGFPHVPCNLVDQSPYKDNTAGSAVIGFIFNVIPGQKCMGASGIKAYACQIGQMASPPNTEQIVFKKFTIADSERRVTLRFAKDGDDRTAYFSDSYVLAISRPGCTQCYGSQATHCSGNHGIRMLTVSINGEVMPATFGKQFDVLCKQEVFDCKAFLDNIIFENFRQTYYELPNCSSNVIFTPHYLASDLTGSHHLSNVVCNGCTLNATAYFRLYRSPSLDWFGGCGKIECTGMNNYLIHDHTGHLLGTPSILLSNNSQIGDNTEGCTRIKEINGHHCLREDLSVLQYENIGPDFNTRIMWPVYLKFDGGSWNTTTNGWKQWDWQGMEPRNHRIGRFVSVIQLYKTYNMTFESQPPGDMRLQIQQKTRQGNPNDWIIVKIYYSRPSSIRIQNKAGLTIKPITLLDNSGENPLNTSICGSNKYFYENYTIHFVVTADKFCQVRVSVTNSIQLNARIDMNISDFFKVDGKTKFIDRICSVLGITDYSRVKVVAVYTGSVQIVIMIEEASTSTVENSTQVNSTETSASAAADMSNLQTLISALHENGTLSTQLNSVGLGKILDLQTEIHYTGPTIDPTQEEQFQNQNSQNAIVIGLILGVVVGSTVIVAIIFSGFVCYIRKRAKVSQKTDKINVKSEKINILDETDSFTNFELKRTNN